jgi:cellobiose epimerase
VDVENGGYHQELDQNGKFKAGEKFLTLQSRQLWFFSTLAAAGIQREPSLDAAKKGYDFIRKHFYDSARGGYYSKVSSEGKTVDDRKHAYLNSFALYALVEYYRATHDKEVLKQAMELFQALEEHAHDTKHLGYEEFFTSDWKLVTDPKESGYVGAIGVKTYNTHLHLMEAFTSLYRETHDELVGKRLAELIDINMKTVKHPEYPCNIDAWLPDWTIVNTPQNLRASYGHDIECAWLVIDAVEALGRDTRSVSDWSTAICKYSIEHGYDTKHHGFFYSGPLGKMADDRKKEWWPQSEALVAMLTMEKLTGDKKYRQLFDETLDFVEKYQVAPNGSWWATLQEDGSPSSNRSRTSMWQGAYHNGRSMLLCEKLLKGE